MKCLKLYESNENTEWIPINDDNSNPKIGTPYLVTILGMYGNNKRYVSIGQYNYDGKGKLRWDHGDRMIAYAELPKPYEK